MDFSGAQQDWETLAATVIGRDTTGILRTVTIDRGSRDGVTPDMAVVTELGLVGRVARVSATTAQIQLVNDVNSFVNATPSGDSRRRLGPGHPGGRPADNLYSTHGPH